MGVAKLDKGMGKDFVQSHLRCLVVVTDDPAQAVAGVLELHKEILEREVVLTRSEGANGNIVCGIVNAVDEGNFLLVSFDLPSTSKTPQKRLGLQNCRVISLLCGNAVSSFVSFRLVAPSVYPVSVASVRMLLPLRWCPSSFCLGRWSILR